MLMVRLGCMCEGRTALGCAPKLIICIEGKLSSLRPLDALVYSLVYRMSPRPRVGTMCRFWVGAYGLQQDDRTAEGNADTIR